MEGPDNLGRSCSVYCEFDISQWTKHRPSVGFFFIDPTISSNSLFMAYGKNRWIVGMRFTTENKKEDFTDEYCLIAKRNIAWSVENAKRFFDIHKAIHAGDHETLKIKLHEQHKNLNFEGLDLGFIYHSRTVKSESDQDISVLPDKYIPTTLPGSRAPQVNLIENGKTISTLDLFEKDFVLLIGLDGERWRIAANQIAETAPFPVVVYKIAPDGDLIDPQNTWHESYNISIDGAVLVRPDGHVAWRSTSMVEDPKTELEKCLVSMIQ